MSAHTTFQKPPCSDRSTLHRLMFFGLFSLAVHTALIAIWQPPRTPSTDVAEPPLRLRLQTMEGVPRRTALEPPPNHQAGSSTLRSASTNLSDEPESRSFIAHSPTPRRLIQRNNAQSSSRPPPEDNPPSSPSAPGTDPRPTAAGATPVTQGDSSPIPADTTVPTSAPVIADFAASLQKIIRDYFAEHARYPSIARRRGWEGTVIVELNFAVTGKITAVRLLKSSGHTALDNAAVSTAAALSLEPYRHWLNNRPYSTRQPVTYRLEE